MRKPFVLLLLSSLFISITGYSQSAIGGSNMRKKTLVIHHSSLITKGDTITLDTLSIIPGSLQIKSHNVLLDSVYYSSLPIEGKIVLKLSTFNFQLSTLDSLVCTYRVFPYLFSQTLQHKDNSVIHPTLLNNQNAYIYQVGGGSSTNDPFDLGTLNKSGSISRGISFGNAQNLNVNSSLNLQLAGKLSNNVNVLVSATDNNLPIQAEGNTQQLQDFDKVFIKLYDKNTSLIAGDYELASPDGYFMKFYKKAEGGLLSTQFMTSNPVYGNKGIDTNKTGIMKVTVGGAISKGEFAENNITPIDGNMGPYLLTGANNETFIVVLSGTESVYLDGTLMVRGQNNDYTIDYNSAQLTFTPKHLITANSRIVVDFQYSAQAYERSLIYAGTQYHKDKLNLYFNIYSEQDAKSQPLLQDLSTQQEQFLASIGNNIQNALTSGVTDTTFNSTQVFYRRVDSAVGSKIYDSVYVYCTDSLKAHFIVNFSQVTQGQGDYVQIQSAANGRVFQWKAPVSGVRQGNYIPFILLITPKKKQMLVSGINYKLSKNTSIFAEGAITNNDVNTFSTIDKGNDVGFAGKVQFKNIDYLWQDSNAANKGNVWRLQTNIDYEGVQKDFSPIERYRSVNFDRDWNRTSDSIFDGQNIEDANFLFGNKKDQVGYHFQAFLEGGNYNATKQDVLLKFTELGFMNNFTGSLLNTKSVDNTSNYYKEFETLSHKLFLWVVGVGESSEKDIFRSRQTDSIINSTSSLFEQANTFQYYQWNTFIRRGDSAKNSYGVNYSERTDYGANLLQDEMTKSLYSRDISFNASFLKNPKSRFKFNVTYHKMDILSSDSNINKGQTPVNDILGQVEYDATIKKGLITTSTYYQAGSGLQPKEEYTYVQVAQGTGVYAWSDFNHNGVKDLNEFYPAPFPDEADYIKVYTPTTQYIKTNSSSFTETFSLRPAAIIKSSNHQIIKSLIARFSEQLSLHADRKTTSNDIWSAYNPFLNQAGDTNIVGLNYSLRNTVFFNQLNPHFGMDYTFSDNRSKTVLEEDGQQSRVNTFQDFHIRVGIGRKFIAEGETKVGQDYSISQFFFANNFFINYYSVQPKINYQPGTNFRISLLFNYADKVNDHYLGGGASEQANTGLEIKYNILTKGSLTANLNYINIAYDGVVSSPVGFEMLQGLSIGNNYTWGITYLCNLSGNIQLNLSYTGRSEPGSPIVNTGNASVRAFF